MSVQLPLAHDSAREHVTGQARYVDDVPLPANTLHLVFGLSTIAAGRIGEMVLDDVRSAPGVHAVLTADDLARPADVSPSVHDEPLLSDGTVHYAGQPLFIVVANSHLGARQAAILARVTYDEHTPILSIKQALEAGSHFEKPLVYTKGDIEKGLTLSKGKVSGSLNVGGQEHFYLEGQAAFATPSDNGDMVVHSSTQHPSEIQHKVAQALGLPFHCVRIETRRMGGGFGGKESQGNALAVACAIVAQKTGRAVKMRYDRDDDFKITGKRHDCRIDYVAGFDDLGRIHAVDFTHYFRCGWSQDLSFPVADRAMLHADNAYDLPHMRITSHRLRTNTQSATAFRGFGGPQGMIGIERVVDHVAHTLGMDSAYVRELNFYSQTGIVTGRGNYRKTIMGRTPYGMPVTDFILKDMIDHLRGTSDYDARKCATRQWNAQNDLIKRGIALTPVKFGISFTLSHLNQAGALVNVYADGSVMVNHGGTEMGQGLFQKVAQVAATTLGVAQDAIRVTATDTSKVPNTSATAASSGSDLNGMAVHDACLRIRVRLRTHLAARYKCSPKAIRFANGQVTGPKFDISFAKAAQSAYQARVSLSSTGFYKTPHLKWDRLKGKGRPFFYFVYGAAVTEVAVDTLTGENRILRTDVLHDCGNSLNPALDIGQIEGAFVQGSGWLTTEELTWDNTGRLRTHAPSTYKIPACSDRPDVFNVALWDAPNRENTIYRSKAVGEPPLMLGISTFLALSDAITACGPHYPDLQAPATSEAVFTAIKRARG